MATKKRKTATTVTKAAKKKHNIRKRDHHAATSDHEILLHLLHFATLNGTRARQELRESREQTAEVVAHATALTAAIERASTVLASSETHAIRQDAAVPIGGAIVGQPEPV